MPPISISRILLPVDFSDRGEEAIQYAAPLAKRYHSEVLLLHVLEPPHVDFAMVELPATLESIAKARCDRARMQLEHFASAGLDGIKVVRRISQGQPADEIVTHAVGADLVVMPTQGHGRLREFLIGSVTAKVLHDCHRPVLTGVHLAGSPGVQEWRVVNLLCAIDLGPESEHVLKWGAQLAAEFGSKVTVIHAGGEPDAAQRVERLVHAAGLQATVIVRHGEPHAVVTDAAQQAGSTLVLIGRGSNASALGRLRAQAYEIVRKSPCPVLSV